MATHFSRQLKPISTSLLFALLGVLQSSANAEDLKAACAANRPPYCFVANGQFKGIEVRLLTEIMSQAGHTLQFQDIPKNRLTAALKRKEVDVIATVQSNGDNDLFFSAPYLDFQNLVISKERHKIALNKLLDLKMHSFIIWQGGWKNLGVEFEEAFKPDPQGRFRPNYFEAFNQQNQNKMFWADRVQLIVIDRRIFEYHRLSLSTEFNTAEPITYHDIIKSKTSYAVAFHRQDCQKQFDEGLRKLRASGEYLTIVEANYQTK